MFALRHSALALAVSSLVVACGSSPQTAPRAPDATPARLTSAEVPRSSTPAPASARTTSAEIPNGAVGRDPSPRHAEEQGLREENARLARERDNARQWAGDEQRRQQDEMKLKHQRDELAETAWLKVEDIDARITMLRTRLDQWTVRSRKDAYARLVEIEQERAALNGMFRRIHNEPQHAFGQFRTDLTARLDALDAKVREALELK